MVLPRIAESGPGSAILDPADQGPLRLILPLVCHNQTGSWKSRETVGWPLLCIHLSKSGILDESSQTLYAAPTRVKSPGLAVAFLLGHEIGNDQTATGFEHTSDFGEPLTFEASGQMMHHQGAEHHVERLVSEGELLDHPELKLDGYVAPSSLRAGTGDLLYPWVNARDAARSANTPLDLNRLRSRAAADI